MHFYMDVKAMQAAMATVVKSLSSKPPIRILEGVYVEAAENSVLFRCSDMSLQIECLIEATVEEEGAIVLPGRLFSEIVRKIDGDTVEMKLSGKTMSIKGERARTSLQCLDPKEFPDMAVTGEVCSVNIPQALCRDMIRQTAFAVAVDETKPVLTGLLCELNEQLFTLVALDGFRLAMRKTVTDRPYENKEYIVPGRSIQEIGRTLGDLDEPVTLQFSRTHLMLDMGSTRIKSRLLDGNYIKYAGLLPNTHTSRVRVKCLDLLESIERAILLSKDGGNYLVKFDITENGMIIKANSPIGNMQEEMDIHLNGNPIEIAFNAKYFADVLKAIDDEEVYLDMNNNVSPCVIRPVQGDQYYYLILPVRFFA